MNLEEVPEPWVRSQLWPAPWAQPHETLSRRPSEAISSLLSHRNYEIINGYCCKPLNLQWFVRKEETTNIIPLASSHLLFSCKFSTPPSPRNQIYFRMSSTNFSPHDNGFNNMFLNEYCCFEHYAIIKTEMTLKSRLLMFKHGQLWGWMLSEKYILVFIYVCPNII